MQRHTALEMHSLPIDELTAHHKAIIKEKASLAEYHELVGRVLIKRGREVAARRMLHHMTADDQQILARALLDFLGPNLGAK